MKKNIRMTNFAPCGPIFKIRNSKLVYSKSYKQITDYIFSITSTFRLLLCYFVHFYTQRNRISKNQHCSPTVHCEDISISPSINTGIAGNRTQANHYAQTYALTLSAIGTPTKIFVILRTNIIVDCEPTEC